jgi:hypothetical protein
MKKEGANRRAALRRIFFILHPSSFILTGCTTPGLPTVDSIHAPIETTTPGYWFDLPASVTVTATDYDRLWRACEEVVAERQFAPERVDYRNGILTTRPLPGAQFWELWRRDVNDGYSMAESNLATVRRRVQVELLPTTSGIGFEARPKVVVERQSSRERRVSIGALNYQVLNRERRGYSTNDYDPDVRPADEYWYATRRDEVMEAALAKDLERKLSRQ